MTTHNHPRTVVGLTVENFKRVTAVQISPDPTNPIVAISGKNAQGKSSVIDAIWAGLTWSSTKNAAKITSPVHEGADKAKVTVDLGDLIVTRTWNQQGKATLEVTNADGAKYKSPQSMLDALMGELTFDPLAFTRLPEKEQTSTLMSLVELDVNLDELDRQRAELYEERTMIGRERKAMGEAPMIDHDLPEGEQSITGLIQQLNDARTLAHNITETHSAIKRTEGIIYDLEQNLEGARVELKNLKAELDQMGEAPDIDALQTKINTAEEDNQAIRANNQARQRLNNLYTKEEEYKSKTDEIAALDKKKADALAAAKFPIDGLGFDDQGVTYNGQPLGQASSAEQVRISTAIAAALNPSIRVISVKDGSLLDSDSRAELAKIADEYGMQIWMELVDETGEVGIVIEDGQIKQD